MVTCHRDGCSESAVYALGFWLYTDDESEPLEMRTNAVICAGCADTMTPAKFFTDENWARLTQEHRRHSIRVPDRALTKMNLVAIGP